MVDAKKIEELRGLLAADTSTDWQTVRTDPAEGADVWWLCAKNSAGQAVSARETKLTELNNEANR